MDARRRLVSLIVDSGWSVSAAARDAGVSRQTAHLWVGRAQSEGLVGMAEHSRRPRTIPRSTPEAITQQVLALAARYPSWGARMLYPLLWPKDEAPVCERTVARILARAGRRVAPERSAPLEPVRFERSKPNELWQTDFKRVGHHRKRTDALSVIDDATRFCIALGQVPGQSLDSVWSVLWAAFGEYGIPREFLSDNGPAFKNNATWRWSSFDLRLMLLGIRSSHGRPYHPQTQGKVERFHGTLQREVAFERGADIQGELSGFRDRYNWIRPHQALQMKTPGSVYQPSTMPRPDRMPEPFFPEGAVTRKGQNGGLISFKGESFKLGRAFEGLPVGLLEDENGILNVVWGTFTLAPLRDLKV